MEKCPERNNRIHCWHITYHNQQYNRVEINYICCHCGVGKTESQEVNPGGHAFELPKHGPFEPKFGTIAIEFSHTEECCPHGTD
jgi:hypothetical protein